MSVPIHCPVCSEMVTETGWGDEDGEYDCERCRTQFEVFTVDGQIHYDNVDQGLDEDQIREGGR